MTKVKAHLKYGAFLSSVIIAVIAAGLYGILNDEITYTISPEYFTKFKYKQFGVNPITFGGTRYAVAAIGFMATWWMGLIIGTCFALYSLRLPNHKLMLKTVLKAILITFSVTIVFALLGFVLGRFYFANAGVNWWLPPDLVNKNDFITVGSIHNFAYLGGFAGLLGGIFYMAFTKKRVSKLA